MQAYKTKFKRISGTRYKEVYDEAFNAYLKIRKRTKRRPYIRSTYFKKDKVFLDLFWRHLHDKNWRDRARRIRFFPAAIDLIRHIIINPKTKENPNNRNEILHRFNGRTAEGHLFYVQIKECKKTNKKSFLSVFPGK